MKHSTLSGIIGMMIAIGVGTASEAAMLESPANGANLSGIGFISGWKCGAGEITVTINEGGHISMAEGQPRGDTRLACGTVHNGFITQVNWNHLSDGTHTAVAYDDGEEFARSTFTVVTAGEEFIDQAPGTAYAADWPSVGENARLVWNESTQHFELAEVGPHVVIPDPDSPEPEPEPEPVSCEGWNTEAGFLDATLAWVRQCLAAGANVNARGWRERTPLHWAAITGDAEVVRILLTAGADVYARDSGGGFGSLGGYTPLHHAVRQGHTEVVRVLLAAGADIHARTNSGATPLHEAIYSAGDAGGGLGNHVEIMRVLLAAGASPNAPDSDGRTPLHMAARTVSGDAEIARVLLAAGADVNARENSGFTPLHYAAQYFGRAEIVRILLAAGADIHARTNSGATPLHYAVDHSDSPAHHHRAETVRVLLAAGANPNAPDGDGRTPLHWVAALSNAPVVGLLLDAGADPTIQDNRGQTPSCAHLDSRC